MTLSLIAAVAANRVIGRNNTLPWSLPEDLRYFKQKTMGHRLLMGRNTFFSLKKPLPGRQNVVISRHLTVAELWKQAGVPPVSSHDSPVMQADSLVLCRTIEEALALPQWGDFSEVFCIGGAQLYESLFPLADQLYLTELQQEVEGDAYFPEWNKSEWEQESHRLGEACPEGWQYGFSEYGRKRNLH
jgi:dihydrofolate reductase